jgi:hypothetical protein
MAEHIIIDSNSNIIVKYLDKLIKFTTSGELIFERSIDYQYYFGSSMTTDSNYNIIISDLIANEVIKLDPNGNELFKISNTSIAGSSVTVDYQDNMIFSKLSNQDNLPVYNAFQEHHKGDIDLYISKVNPSGTIVFSTYLGGSEQEAGEVKIDNDNNIIVTGQTYSLDFPTQNEIQTSIGSNNQSIFITKFDPDGSVAFSTRYGGSETEYFVDRYPVRTTFHIDRENNILLAGNTRSSDLSIENAYQSSYGGGIYDLFLSKFDPDGVLVYSTYMGGNSDDRLDQMAVDINGNFIVSLQTKSLDYPLKDPQVPTHSNHWNDYTVTKLDPFGSVIFSSFYHSEAQSDRSKLLIDNKNRIIILSDDGRNITLVNPLAGNESYNENTILETGMRGSSYITILNPDGSIIRSSFIFHVPEIDNGETISLDNNFSPVVVTIVVVVVIGGGVTYTQWKKRS